MAGGIGRFARKKESSDTGGDGDATAAMTTTNTTTTTEATDGGGLQLLSNVASTNKSNTSNEGVMNTNSNNGAGYDDDTMWNGEEGGFHDDNQDFDFPGHNNDGALFGDEDTANMMMNIGSNNGGGDNHNGFNSSITTPFDDNNFGAEADPACDIVINQGQDGGGGKVGNDATTAAAKPTKMFGFSRFAKKITNSAGSSVSASAPAPASVSASASASSKEVVETGNDQKFTSDDTSNNAMTATITPLTNKTTVTTVEGRKVVAGSVNNDGNIMQQKQNQHGHDHDQQPSSLVHERAMQTIKKAPSAATATTPLFNSKMLALSDDYSFRRSSSSRINDVGEEGSRRVSLEEGPTTIHRCVAANGDNSHDGVSSPVYYNNKNDRSNENFVDRSPPLQENRQHSSTSAATLSLQHNPNPKSQYPQHQLQQQHQQQQKTMMTTKATMLSKNRCVLNDNTTIIPPAKNSRVTPPVRFNQSKNAGTTQRMNTQQHQKQKFRQQQDNRMSTVTNGRSAVGQNKMVHYTTNLRSSGPNYSSPRTNNHQILPTAKASVNSDSITPVTPGPFGATTSKDDSRKRRKISVTSTANSQSLLVENIDDNNRHTKRSGVANNGEENGNGYGNGNANANANGMTITGGPLPPTQANTHCNSNAEVMNYIVDDMRISNENKISYEAANKESSNNYYSNDDSIDINDFDCEACQAKFIQDITDTKDQQAKNSAFKLEMETQFVTVCSTMLGNLGRSLDILDKFEQANELADDILERYS